MDHLRPAETVIDDARRIAAQVGDRLRPLLPPHELTLTGGSSVPGALTKGDVDLHLTVAHADFAATVATLRSLYRVVHPEIWQDTLATFAVDAELPTGIAVTPAGSEHDHRFRRAWELLRADPALLAEYNAVKAGGADGYEERKSAFFTRIVTSQAWMEKWRDDMRSGLTTALSTFESRFGYPPGEHEIGGPATERELAGLAELHGTALPADLVSCYRVVAEVRLPDIGNGYWIHRPPLPGEDPHALSDGREIVVFGTDGGGALFALPGGSGGPVLRLSDGVCLGGVYDADCAVPVAESLQDFLDLLRRELSALVPPAAGRPG